MIGSRWWTRILGRLVRKLRTEHRIAQRIPGGGVGITVRPSRTSKTKNRDIVRSEAVLVYFGYDLEPYARSTE